MSNAVSRGHGRGKPNQGFYPDHNNATPMSEQSPQFMMPFVPGQANYSQRMPPSQIPQQPYQQYVGPQQQQQYNHNNYYPQQHNQPPPPQLHPQQQQQQQQPQYGGYNHNRQEYVPQQMYNQQYGYQGPQQVYQTDTVNYSHQTPQVPPMQPPVQQEPRKKNVLMIVDPTTNKAIDVPTRQAPVSVVPPVPVVPIGPEEEKKKEDIAREMREKVRKELLANAAGGASEEVKTPVALNPAYANFSVPPPPLGQSLPPAQHVMPPQMVVPPPPQPKTPEAPIKSVEETVHPEILTPVSSPHVSETATTTPGSATAESASTGSDARVTPTLQKEESKEEIEDDKFEEQEREETPEVAESQTEKTPEELAEEKARKEAEDKEKKQLLEKDLEAKMERLINEGNADIPNGTFGREFMVTIREIEKLFSRTPCPLSPQQLSDFGLDIKSMRVADKKPNFTPNWVPNKGGGARQQPYRGRTTTDGTGRGAQPRDRGGHNKRPPPVRQSIERVQRVALPSSKDAWKPDRQKTSDNVPEDEAAIKEVCKKVRALMNKVTPTSQGPLTQEFISYNVSSNETQLNQVVEIVFDKAVEEPKFCALYAEICKSQVNHELNKHGGVNGKSAFRNTVLVRTQNFFQDKRDMDEDKKAIIEKEEDPIKREALFAEERQKFRRRKFGVMAFIGHLYRNTLLSTKIVVHCTCELFTTILPKKVDDKEKPMCKDDVDEESVHCGLQLIETVGAMLDKSKDSTPAFLDQWLQKLDLAKPYCTNKIRFMIMNLIELRKEKWVPRKSTESGPKKIDEIHKDIRQEKIENEKARDQYDRDRDRRHGGGGGGGGLRPNSNSLRKQMPPARNSLDRNRQVQHSDQKRAQAAASTKLASSNITPKNISLSAMDNNTLGKSKKEWQTGASGGGNTSEAAAAAAPPPKNAWVRRDSNDQRKRSTVDDKQAALAAAKEISSMTISARRSTSQTSIPDRVEEELSDEEKVARGKIMNTVKSDLGEFISGDLPLKEMVDAFKTQYVDKEKYGKPSLTVVYEMVVRAVTEKMMKEEERKHLAFALRMSLASKSEKQAFIDGTTRFCKFAVDADLYQDFPKLWSDVAEVLMKVMHADPKMREAHPDSDISTVENIALAEMGPAFLAAKTSGKKKYDLFVQLIKRWADEEIAQCNGVEMLKWEFKELTFREEMVKDGLREEMEAVEASNGQTLANLLFKD